MAWNAFIWLSISALSLSWLLTSNQLLFKREVSVSSASDYMLPLLVLASLTPLIHLLLYPELDSDIYRHELLFPFHGVFMEVGC